MRNLTNARILPLIAALLLAFAPVCLGAVSDDKNHAKMTVPAPAPPDLTPTSEPSANVADSDTTGAQPAAADPPAPVAAATPSLAQTQDAASSTDADTNADNNSRWAPMAAITGNPGLFTLETGETLPRGGFESTAGFNKFSRDPGNITVLSADWAVAAGISKNFSVFAEIEGYNYVHVGAPSSLSLSSATAGFPQYQNTIYRSILPLPGVLPAYVEDYPFAGHSGGGVGNVDLGFKWNLVSENRGGPLSVSIKSDFYIPTVTSLSSLLSNGSQTGTFSYGIGAEVSKSMFQHTTVSVLNVEYQLMSSPSFNISGTKVGVDLADELHIGAGFLILPRSRIQIISEYNATIYVGSHTENTTFGPRDPVDQVSGIRFYFWRNFAIDIAYRYMVDLTNHRDRNGFVLKLDTARWPTEVAPGGNSGSDAVTATCSAEKSVVSANSGEHVIAHVVAADRQGRPLTYRWTASAGQLQEAGPAARWNPAGLAAGDYVLTARVDDGLGHSAACSFHVTVQ